MSKKDLALQQALDQITSAFGKGSIMWLGRSVSPKNVPVVPTGSFALDLALGIGGLPKVYLDPCMKKFLAHLSHVDKLEPFLMYLMVPGDIVSIIPTLFVFLLH